MKKIIQIASILLVIVMIAACSGQTAAPTEVDTSSETSAGTEAQVDSSSAPVEEAEAEVVVEEPAETLTEAEQWAKDNETGTLSKQPPKKKVPSLYTPIRLVSWMLPRYGLNYTLISP